jgi:hypothetical protein
MKRVKGGICQRAADRQGVLDHIKLALHDRRAGLSRTAPIGPGVAVLGTAPIDRRH